MVEVFLLTTDPTSSKVGKVSAWFDLLQESLPHKLHLIDLRHQRFFEKRPEETLIVRVDEIEVVDPENFESLRQVLVDATNRANSLDYRPTGAKDRLSGRERFSLWFSRHYLALVNIIVAVYVFLPILAPVMMKLGQTESANRIYRLYRPLCHQLAFRSFFLFGEQAYYPVDVPVGSDMLSYSEISGNSGEDLWLASEFTGNAQAGYKIALCQRDVAIYGSILLFGIVFALTRRKLKPLLLVAVDSIGDCTDGAGWGLAACEPAGPIVPWLAAFAGKYTVFAGFDRRRFWLVHCLVWLPNH